MSRSLSILVLLLTALTSACGHAPHLEIDPALQPLVEQFKTDAAAQGHPLVIDDLIVEFGDTERLGEFVQGDCHRESGKTPRIVISQELDWATASPVYREKLVYHELGHCVLNLEHESATFQPANQSFSLDDSIMYPELPNADFYAQYRDHYLKHLFQRD